MRGLGEGAYAQNLGNFLMKWNMQQIPWNIYRYKILQIKGKKIQFLKINRSHFSILLSKSCFFELAIVDSKSVAMLLPTRKFKATIESFPMRYYMMFYLKKHKNYQKSK